MIDAQGRTVQVFAERTTGLDLYLNTGMIDAAAIDALDDGQPPAVA